MSSEYFHSLTEPGNNQPFKWEQFADLGDNFHF